MSLPSTLYKFSDACGALAILQTQTLRTKSPLDFNDPFEAFPAYDEERKNYMIATRKAFYERLGFPGGGNLTAEGNEEQIPVENWVDLNSREHDQLFERVYNLYRVLCLSKSPTATLLWSHYAQSHEGIAIGFNLQSDDFPKGLFPEGINVEYSTDREDHLLPVEFYRHNALNTLITSPEGHFTRNDGTHVTIEEQNQLYVRCLEKILSSKHAPWKYEEELRILYNLAKPDRHDLAQAAGYDVVRFSPEMVTDVIFGYRCPTEVIESSAELLRNHYPAAQMNYVDLHPYKYEVRVHQGDLDQILATQKRRTQQSFRARIQTSTHSQS